MEIQLSRGKLALIDDTDVERVMPYRWFAMQTRKDKWYAAAHVEGRNKLVYLHRFLAGPKHNEVVDHVNGDGLDCRRENLRVCTNTENQWNTSGKTFRKSSQYKGVTFDKAMNRWKARLGVSGKVICSPTFSTAEEAARAYDELAIAHHGNFARLNFSYTHADKERIRAGVQSVVRAILPDLTTTGTVN
jgi:hypothetical protein